MGRARHSLARSSRACVCIGGVSAWALPACLQLHACMVRLGAKKEGGWGQGAREGRRQAQRCSEAPALLARAPRCLPAPPSPPLFSGQLSSQGSPPPRPHAPAQPLGGPSHSFAMARHGPLSFGVFLLAVLQARGGGGGGRGARGWRREKAGTGAAHSCSPPPPSWGAPAPFRGAGRPGGEQGGGGGRGKGGRLPAALRGGERLAARPPPLHRSRWLWLWQSWCAWSCGGTSPGTGPLPFGPGPSPAPTPASSPPAGGRRRGARALRHRPLAHPLHPHPPRSANICAYMYFVVGASILASLLLCFTQVGACSLGSPPHRDAHPPATHPVHPAPPPPCSAGTSGGGATRWS